MKIGILGTRGIPNNYGGFEQFAEYLSLGLVEKGHEVFVYNSHTHPYQDKTWKGVHIIHCKDPEHKVGTVGQFLYDRNCIRDSRKRDFDILLQLGYTSSSVWGRILPRKSTIITTNMDGLEWKRSKYSKKVQAFLKYAEKLAIKYSHHLIADSVGIQQHLKENYGVSADYIPYGAHLFNSPDTQVLEQYGLKAHEYSMLIARLEPENNIETILDGFTQTQVQEPFLVIGKHETKFGTYLKDKFAEDKRIQFLGGIYNIDHLNNLRHHSRVYFHGHSVGGTNPSLLEAMASNALICAHENIFNASILEKDALYFTTSDDVARVLNNDQLPSIREVYIENNRDKIRNLYSWERIADQYEEHFMKIIEAKTAP